MSRVIAMALTVVVLFITVPNVAEAYMGPGAGLSAIGTIIALIGAILLAAVGFIWYPLKRIRRKLAEKRDKNEQTHGKTEEGRETDTS